jgi:hypothetical protein
MKEKAMAHEQRTLRDVILATLQEWRGSEYYAQFPGAFPAEENLLERIADIGTSAADTVEVVLDDGTVLEVKITRKRGRLMRLHAQWDDAEGAG